MFVKNLIIFYNYLQLMNYQQVNCHYTMIIILWDIFVKFIHNYIVIFKYIFGFFNKNENNLKFNNTSSLISIK